MYQIWISSTMVNRCMSWGTSCITRLVQPDATWIFSSDTIYRDHVHPTWLDLWDLHIHLECRKGAIPVPCGYPISSNVWINHNCPSGDINLSFERWIWRALQRQPRKGASYVPSRSDWRSDCTRQCPVSICIMRSHSAGLMTWHSMLLLWSWILALDCRWLLSDM